VEPLGSHVLVTVTIEGTEFKVVAPTDFAAEEDSELWLRPDPAKVRWFDPDTRQAVQPARDPAGSHS
jgi:multiple sugar transport system ATP-binding protein